MKLVPAALAMAAVLVLGASAHAASSQTFSQGGTIFQVSVRPLTEMRFDKVVRQQYDLSCGAAAAATIFQHFYGADIAEKEIIEEVLKTGNQEEISKRGFSMLELKKFAEGKGFVSEGFRLASAEKLRELKAPVLTLIDTRGYKHFVVLKKVVGNEVIIADPAFGNTVKTLSDFDQLWNKTILVVLSPELNGKDSFINDYSLRARTSEISLLLQRGLQSITAGAGEF